MWHGTRSAMPELISQAGHIKTRISLHGNPYRAWVNPMALIPHQVLDCAIYLYPTRLDAKNGERAGGSGFLIGVPWASDKDKHHVYAVTASHVVREGNAIVIRLNTQDGMFDVLDTNAGAWIHHAISDVAVCPIDLTGKYQYRFISDTYLLTEAGMKSGILPGPPIGPGQDVFFVGRFFAHDGRQRNTPTVRFGTISMMPSEPIPVHNRPDQIAFLVEFHSIGGYSGSPVFVNPYFWGISISKQIFGIPLLGVDFMHFPNWATVKESDQKTDCAGRLQVALNTGVAGVIPAWKISDILNSEEMVSQRLEAENKASTTRIMPILDSQQKPLTHSSE